MAFASPTSSTTLPKPVIAIQSNSYYNLCHESGQQESPTLTRHAEQHNHNAHPLPPLQSFQTVYGITTAGPNQFPSSWSTPNVSHPYRSLNDVKNGEPYQSSPELPPLTDNDFLTSITPKNEISSPHSKNHVVLSSILHLKHLKPAIVIQNSGSAARDHLASERTFLAYVHTSLSLSSAGVAIVQLLTIAELVFPASSPIPMLEESMRMKRFALPVGALTQVLALCILFVGEWFTSFFLSFFFWHQGFVNGDCLSLIPLSCLVTLYNES